ncbi:MAG TPA: hypothetical protein VGI43_08125 [Mucilaginibacter sp.]|jgi:hypothetical protein
MNWIINKSKKLRYHTDLTVLFKPIYDDIENYNWIISDFEFNGSPNFSSLPINYDHDYFILTPAQFKMIVDTDIQTIWGVILGVPISKEIKIDENNLPFAEGYPLLFEDGNIQYSDAVIEIICFDSSYTIVKFKDMVLSDKFKFYFDEALSLEKFRGKYINKGWRGY